MVGPVSFETSRRRFLGTMAGGLVGLGPMHPARAGARPAARLPDPGTVPVIDPALLSAVEAASLLQSGQLHPRELLDACLRRSRDHDGGVGAWIHLYPDLAYAAADAAATRLSAARASGEPVSPVCGLPIALKDLFAVGGLPLTASSNVLRDNVAAGDSGVWRRLREAGAVLLGHVHTDEFAIGVVTPQVANPWNPQYSPGGSSGGSAAAVAARFVPLSVGSDTGGSLRLPASSCGVSAIKPTYGRITSHGMIPLTWTRDHPGPIGHSLADASLLLGVLAGAEADDPVTAAGPGVPEGGYPLVPPAGTAPLAGVRIGVPHGATDRLAPELRRLFDEFLATARALGAETVPVSMPHPPDSLLAGDTAEMGAYHRQFVDRLGDYRIDLAPLVSAAVASLALPVADYFGLERDRLRYQHQYNAMFRDHALDVIALPGALDDGCPRDAFAGLSVLSGVAGDVQWANYTGAPAVSFPVGRSAVTGLPFGVQLGALPWQEAALISVGLALQEALPVWRDVPPVAPAPRELPVATPAAPGPGPDPTNTLGAAAPVRTPATLSTGGW
ncbi:amidase [Rhodococcus aetherivorans]|uniref:amidase n=1 Tax=Rhodococcus aetherivorans TaxID=191292 RepID=UPI0036601946